MRIVMVWIVAITLIFIISVGWYVSQPVIIGVSRAINASIVGTETNARNTITIIEFVSFIWGPVFILFILLWAFVSSARRDVESEVYG